MLAELYDEDYVRAQLDEFVGLHKAFTGNPSSYRKIVKSRLIPMQEALKRHRDVVDCQKGCSYCCHYRVEAYTFEIVALYYHIQTQFTPEQKGQSLERLRAAAGRIAPLDPISHFQTNIQCPLLVDGTCSVYPVRPSGCAAFYSRDRSVCEYQHQNPHDLDTVGAGIPQLNVDTQVEKDIAQLGLEWSKRDSRQYELVTSLLALFDNPGLIGRWKKGRTVFNGSSHPR